MRHVTGIAALAAAALLAACSPEDAKKAPAPPTVTLVASPTQLPTGEDVTLTWTSSRASTCSAAGSWSGTTPLSGNQTFALYNPGSYLFVLTCSGPGGSNVAIAEVEAIGNNNNGGNQLISVTLTADPATVAVGESTTLTWSAQDAASCTASGAWSGSKAPTGSETVVVNAAGYNDYTLNCTGPAGSGYQHVYVQGLQAIVNLDADPLTAGVGETTTLTWSTTYASTCTASGGWSGTKAASGTEVVAVSALGNNTYELTCSDPGAATTQSLAVSGVVPDVTFGVFPAKPEVGETVTLSWDATYALGCVASGDWSGPQAAKGTATLAVSAPGTLDYTIACSNDGGTDTQSVQATAVAAPALPPATGYMNNARHDGFVTFAGGITLPLTDIPTWTRDLGAEVGYAVIADGLVYVISQNTDSSYGNRMFALSQATGATVWGPVGLPGVYFWNGHTYDDGRIFTLNFDGTVRAFNAATGASLWTQAMPGYWHDAEPVAFGGLVFASGNYGTVAFDQVTGATKWTRSYYSEASPAVTSSGFYFLPSYGNFVALNPQTGEDLWTGTIRGDHAADATVRNGRVYARYIDGSTFLADAATGASAGSLASQRALAVTDAIAITLYSGTLTAWSTTSGTAQWSFTGDGGLVTTPVVVNGTVFIGSTSGKVYAVNAATGAQQWFGTRAAMEAPDQWNGRLLAGPTAGEGLLVVTGGTTVSAWKLK